MTKQQALKLFEEKRVRTVCKLWMAKVASERLNQIQDPELSIDQALMDYKRMGYSDNWINQRLKPIGCPSRWRNSPQCTTGT